mmetsp:Transcript_17124/g.47081  ORF Transcript_17124/g.47081 Transcript_17124/m.47081 type:complete len:369 (+) Transcript_17124:167-1273(+)
MEFGPKQHHAHQSRPNDRDCRGVSLEDRVGILEDPRHDETAQGRVEDRQKGSRVEIVKESVGDNVFEIHNAGINPNRQQAHTGELDLGVGQRVLTDNGTLDALRLDDLLGVYAGKSTADGNAERGQNPLCVGIHTPYILIAGVAIAAVVVVVVVIVVELHVAEHDSNREQRQTNDLYVPKLLADNSGRKSRREEEFRLHQNAKHGSVQIRQGNVFQGHLEVVGAGGNGNQHRVLPVVPKVLHDAAHRFLFDEQDVEQAEGELGHLAANDGGGREEFRSFLHDVAHQQVFRRVLDGQQDQDLESHGGDSAAAVLVVAVLVVVAAAAIVAVAVAVAVGGGVLAALFGLGAGIGKGKGKTIFGRRHWSHRH